MTAICHFCREDKIRATHLTNIIIYWKRLYFKLCFRSEMMSWLRFWTKILLVVSLSMGLLAETVIRSIKFDRFSVRLKLSVMLRTFPVLSSPGGFLIWDWRKVVMTPSCMEHRNKGQVCRGAVPFSHNLLHTQFLIIIIIRFSWALFFFSFLERIAEWDYDWGAYGRLRSRSQGHGIEPHTMLQTKHRVHWRFFTTTPTALPLLIHVCALPLSHSSK